MQNDSNSIIQSIDNQEKPSKNIIKKYLDKNNENNIQLIIKNLKGKPLSRADVQHYLTERERLFNKYFEKYADTIPTIVIWYLIVVGIFIFLSGLRIYNIELLKVKFIWALSDSVLIALLGTTTTTILGLMYIVSNHLFPKKQ